MTNIQEVQTGRRIPQGAGASPMPAAVPNTRSIVDDVAQAVERFRRIEGERGLYLMLETLLGGSRDVLAQHGVVPPARETAELESLRAQLQRALQSRDNNHAYAVHYADALTKIANLDGAEDLQDAQKLAKEAMTVVFGEAGK